MSISNSYSMLNYQRVCFWVSCWIGALIMMIMFSPRKLLWLPIEVDLFFSILPTYHLYLGYFVCLICLVSHVYRLYLVSLAYFVHHVKLSCLSYLLYVWLVWYVFFPIFNPFVAWYLSPFAIYFPHLSCYLFIVLLILQPHLTTKNNIRTELRGLVSFICGRRCTLLSIPPLPQNKVCTWCVHILEYMQDRCMCEGSMCFNIFQSPEGPWATVCNPVRPLFDPE
jgi:hypothetical protein